MSTARVYENASAVPPVFTGFLDRRELLFNQEVFVPPIGDHDSAFPSGIRHLGVLQTDKAQIEMLLAAIESETTVHWVFTIGGASTLGIGTAAAIPVGCVLDISDYLTEQGTVNKQDLIYSSLSSVFANCTYEAVVTAHLINTLFSYLEDLQLDNWSAVNSETSQVSVVKGSFPDGTPLRIESGGTNQPATVEESFQVSNTGQGSVPVTWTATVTTPGSFDPRIDPFSYLCGQSTFMVDPGTKQVKIIVAGELYPYGSVTINVYIGSGINERAGASWTSGLEKDSGQSGKMAINIQSTTGTVDQGQTWQNTTQVNDGTAYSKITLVYPGSQLDLHVYDSLGNHVGVNYSTGEVENQITGAVYTGEGSTYQTIVLPNSGGNTYRVEIAGVETHGAEPFDLVWSDVPDQPPVLSVTPDDVYRTVDVDTEQSVQMTLVASELTGVSDYVGLTATASDLVSTLGTIPSACIKFDAANLDVSAGGQATITATVDLPSGLPLGVYNGTFVFGPDEVQVPVELDLVTDEVILNWSDPADIVYGTALGDTQLDATADVPGTFVYTPASGTVLHAGKNQTLAVTFTPTDTTDYTTATKTVSINVDQATPTITWASPADIVYGTALGNTQLDATASVPGTFVYTPASGTVLHAGKNQTLAVTFTPTDTTDYTTATQTVTIDVDQATPTITWASPADIVYGTALGNAQLDATASVPGTFTYTPAGGTVLRAGKSQTLSVSFTPTDTTDYTTASSTVTINVDRATPTVTWSSPADITYGAALGATQLDATASVPGAFAYTPASGTVLKAGKSQTLSITFTPTDATDYITATQTVSIDVAQAVPPITWSNPADIVYGAALGDTQLDATANVPGTFVYSPTGGAVLHAGANQTLSVAFAPSDSTDYTTATKTVTINVGQATPTTTWPSPADIVYGTALGNTQLDATASVPGTFVYTPAGGTVLNTGANQSLSAIFTPTDTTDYTTAAKTVKINVSQATPTITWPSPADIVYGAALGNTQLDATASVPGAFSYSPASGTVLHAGKSQTLLVTFTPTDTTDYTTATATVSINVSQATPTITWADPADIAYGAALGNTQLDATASVPGTFSYSPASGTVLKAGKSQPLSVIFTPTDTTDCTTASSTVTINVSQATPTFTWSNPADIVYGTALGNTQLDATASVPGTFVYTPASGTMLHAGTNQSLSVTFTPTDTADYTTATQNVSINVEQAQLTITADNKIKSQGAPLPTLTFTCKDLVGDDTLTTQPTLATTATTASVPGTYSITTSGGTASTDYAITHVDGTLRVVVDDSLGGYDAATSIFYLRDSNTTGLGTTNLLYGVPGIGLVPLCGDWDGDGTETIGLYDPTTSLFLLRNSNSSGIADAAFWYGAAGCGFTPVVGDWNGDGTDTVGLFDPTHSVFYLRNSNTTGMADTVVSYSPTDATGLTPIVGDWDGSGTDRVGLYDATTSVFHLRCGDTAGSADIPAFAYGVGNRGEKPVVGDWTGTGKDTMGLYDPATSLVYLRCSNTTGNADIPAFVYGPANTPAWTPLAGHWAGTGQNLSAADEITATDVPKLTQPELQPVVQAAVARWARAGLDVSHLTKLAQTQFAISDLPGSEWVIPPATEFISTPMRPVTAGSLIRHRQRTRSSHPRPTTRHCKPSMAARSIRSTC